MTKTKELSFIVRYQDKTDIDIIKEKWLELGVAAAIASHELLWDEINELYYKHEVECIKAYHNSVFYNHPMYKTYTAEIEDMIVKTVSLYAWNGESEEFLVHFIKKGYKRYYDYVENQHVFSWDSFMGFMLERERDTTEVKKSNIAMVVLYLTIKVIHQNDEKSLSLLKGTMGNIIQNLLIIPYGDKEFHERVEKYSLTGLRKLSETFGFKISKEMNVDKLLQKHEDYLINQIPRKERRKTKEDIFNVLYKMGLYRYYKPLTTIIRDENYNDYNFTSNTEILREDLLTIHGIFEIAKESGRLKDEEYEIFLVSSIVILMLLKQYRGLSEFYADKTKKEQELLIRKEEVNEEKKKLDEEKTSMEEELNRLKRQLKEKDERIQQLEKKVKSKESEIEENENLKKELYALREYVFKNENEEKTHNDEEVEVDANVFKDKKIAIIGGHQRWQNKIKQAIPNVRTIHPDEIGVDLSFVKNMDIVCFETSYNNHSIYQRTLKEIEYSKAKLHYLNSQLNVDRLAREISKLFSS